MKSFQYCIWLQPENNTDILCEFYKIPKGFEPHITLHYNINTLEEAIEIFEKINKNPVYVKLTHIVVDNEVKKNEDKFFNMYYKVEQQGKDVSLPDNAHISFLYDYENPITEEQVKLIQDKLYKIYDEHTFICMNKYIIKKCDNHYSEWETVYTQ